MTKRISIFILVSVAAHAAVLGLIGFDVQTPRVPGASMQVSIQATKASQAKKATLTAKPHAVSQPQKPKKKTQRSPLAIKTTTAKTKVVASLVPQKLITQKSILVNLSGRGDKDLDFVVDTYGLPEK